MTQKLKEVIDALSSLEDLPEEEQNAIASRIIDVLDQAQNRSAMSGIYRVPFGGRRYSKEERAAAVAEWDAMEKPSLGGLSIRDLIEEGRT